MGSLPFSVWTDNIKPILRRTIVIGMKLLSDEKHDLTEIPLNDYAYQLNLTIRRLNRNDFGSYSCSAENLLGKAEGTIRLQGNLFTLDYYIAS